MARLHHLSSLRVVLLSALLVFGLTVTTSFAADVTTPFVGKAVNSGTVTHEMQGGKHILTVSADFKVPDSPGPHWQVTDSKGTVYLLGDPKWRQPSSRLFLGIDHTAIVVEAPRRASSVTGTRSGSGW